MQGSRNAAGWIGARDFTLHDTHEYEGRAETPTFSHILTLCSLEASQTWKHHNKEEGKEGR